MLTTARRDTKNIITILITMANKQDVDNISNTQHMIRKRHPKEMIKSKVNKIMHMIAAVRASLSISQRRRLGLLDKNNMSVRASIQSSR